MKITMTMPIRDAQDLIEDNIRYHFAHGIDSFIIILHLCKDDTQKIVEELSKTIPIYYETLSDPVFEISKVRTRMAQLAKEKFGAEWIINNDSDEIWYSAENLKTVFSRYAEQGYNVIYAQRFNMLPYSENPSTPFRPIVDFQYMISHPVTLDKSRTFDTITAKDFLLRQVNGKAATSTEGLNSVERGSHEIDIDNRKSIVAPEITIMHYFLTSKDSFLSTRAGLLDSMLKDPSLASHQSWHLRLFDYLQNQGLLEKFAEELFPNSTVVEQLLGEGIIEKSENVANALKSL